jgi:hypothetical protein
LRTPPRLAKPASSLPSLLDTADELKAVAANLGAVAGNIHLGSDANEMVVKRRALATTGWSISRPTVSSPRTSRDFAEPSLALPKQPTELDDGLLTASDMLQMPCGDWTLKPNFSPMRAKSLILLMAAPKCSHNYVLKRVINIGS